MKVSLGEIEDRERYSISFPQESEALKVSLREVGLLEPLLLRQTEEGFELVCGAKRLKALEELGHKEAEARVFRAGELTEGQAVRMAVAHNLPHGLNLMEKARAAERLERLGVPQEEVIGRWLPLMGLQPHKGLWAKLKALLRLPEGIQTYLVEQGLSLSASLEFLPFEAEELEALEGMLRSLRPGENKLKEVLRHLLEVSRREGISAACLLEQAREIWDQRERPRVQRLEGLRRWLRRRRYPRFSSLEEEFRKFKASLHLPPEVAFHHPPFFEGEEFRIELRFRDREGLKEAAERLLRVARGLAAPPTDPLRRFKGLP